jgi:hypothetical protein
MLPHLNKHIFIPAGLQATFTFTTALRCIFFFPPHLPASAQAYCGSFPAGAFEPWDAGLPFWFAEHDVLDIGLVCAFVVRERVGVPLLKAGGRRWQARSILLQHNTMRCTGAASHAFRAARGAVVFLAFGLLPRTVVRDLRSPIFWMRSSMVQCWSRWFWFLVAASHFSL